VARMGAAQAPSSGSVVDPRTRRPAPVRRLAGAPAAAWLALVLAVAAAVRAWQLNGLGFNSDEAVYAGQAAAIADHPELGELFPVFRAHPLLVQTLLSVGFRLHLAEGFERLTVAALGVATVGVVFELGRLLYGRPAGLVAALLMALMPYHVVVTRQVLLDGPMTLFATLTLLLLVRFVLSGRPGWLYGAGAAMGLTVLSKETSIVLLGAALLPLRRRANQSKALPSPVNIEGAVKPERPGSLNDQVEQLEPLPRRVLEPGEDVERAQRDAAVDQVRQRYRGGLAGDRGEGDHRTTGLHGRY